MVLEMLRDKAREFVRGKVLEEVALKELRERFRIERVG